MSKRLPFWRTKSLGEMTLAEWESLCDGCGRCCLVKLEEDGPDGVELENPSVYFTDVGCRLLDGDTCRCKNYPQRERQVPDCVRLTPEVVGSIGWLPPTCAYRLIDEGRELYWWHPLVSGDPDTVHQAGVSIRGRVSEDEDQVPAEQLEDHIVSWPLALPRRARRRRKAA